RDRGGVHHLQLLFQHFLISDAIESRCRRVLHWIGGVYAVNFGSFENNLRLNFKSAQGSSRVGGKERIPGPGGENYDSVFFEVTHGAAPNKRLGQLRDRNC